jgi:hypothetical protein
MIRPLKVAPDRTGAELVDPFDGDVYLVRYMADDGNCVSRLFFNAGLAKKCAAQVAAEGGRATIHRTGSSWALFDAVGAKGG